MSRPFKIPKNLWIILVTLGLIIAAYFLYFNVYLESKEQKIIDSRFRVLNQYSRGIKDIFNVYLKNELNYLDEVTEAYDSLIQGNFQGNRIPEESLQKKNPSLLKLNKNIHVTVVRDQKVMTGDTLDAESNIIMGSPPWIFNAYQLQGRNATAVFYFDIGSVVGTPLSRQVFDGLIVIKEDDVVYNTLNTEIELYGTEAPDPSSSSLKEGSTNLLLPGNKEANFLVYSGSQQSVSIDNIPYQLFLKPIDLTGEPWYIGGLEKDIDYRSGIRTLDPWVVVLISVVLIVIFLGLPILKLKIMSKYGQLYTSTILTSALSVLLGSAFLTLLLFYLFHQPSISAGTDSQLEDLADTMEQSFYEELRSMAKQLAHYDRNFNRVFPELSGNSFINNVLNPGTYANKTRSFENNAGIRPDTSLWQPVYYPYFDYVFWVREDGWQVAEIFTFDNKSSNLINVGTRDYFNEYDQWIIPADRVHNSPDKFRLESIYSLTSGVAKAAIGIPSGSQFRNVATGKEEHLQVAAMTARMYSITNTVMPPGYGFVIIDREGTVWFHHNPSRNMQENFFQETGNNKYLQAAIYSGTSKAINLEYNNHPQRAFVRPLQGMPLTLIVFADKQPGQTHQIQVITLTLAYYGILFFLLFLISMLLLAIERRKPGSKHLNLVFELSRPLIKHHRFYRQLIADNILIFILTILFTSMAKPMDAVAIVFPAVLLTTLHNYAVFNSKYSIRHLSGFLIPFFVVPVVLVNLIYLIVTHYQNASGLFFFFQVSAFMLLVFRNRMFKMTKPGNFTKSYLQYLVSLLVVISVLPVLVFSSKIARYEDKIRLRHVQLELLRAYEDKNTLLAGYYESVDDPQGHYERKRQELGVYTWFYDQTHITDNHVVDDETTRAESHHLLDSLACYLRPFYTQMDVESKYLVFGSSHNNEYSWYRDNGGLLLVHDKLYPLQKATKTAIHSSVPFRPVLLPYAGEKLPAIIYNLIFVISIVGAMYLLYRIVKFGINILFPLNIARTARGMRFENLLNSAAGSDTIVFLMKNSSRQEGASVAELISNDRSVIIKDAGTSPLKAFDLKPGKKAVKKPDQVLLIDHGEALFYSSKAALKLLNTSEEDQDRTIFIITSKDPDSLRNTIRELDIGRVEKERLEVLVNSSSFLNIPALTKNIELEKIPSSPAVLKELASCDFLSKRASLFSPDYFVSGISPGSPEYEQFIDQVSFICRGYYRDLLTSCDDRERYILYDISTDMIINPKNAAVILGLIRKGLLVSKKDGLAIMNESFRRYVLVNTSGDTLKQMEGRLTDAGNWNSYRAVLVILMIGLLIFLWLANESLLENLNRLLVVIGAGIATVTGILSFMSKGKKVAGEK